VSSFVLGSLVAGLLIGAGLIPWLLVGLIAACACAGALSIGILEPRLPRGSNGVTALATTATPATPQSGNL
jgi:hypothetical protein